MRDMVMLDVKLSEAVCPPTAERILWEKRFPRVECVGGGDVNAEGEHLLCRHAGLSHDTPVRVDDRAHPMRPLQWVRSACSHVRLDHPDTIFHCTGLRLCCGRRGHQRTAQLELARAASRAASRGAAQAPRYTPISDSSLSALHGGCLGAGRGKSSCQLSPARDHAKSPCQTDRDETRCQLQATRLLAVHGTMARLTRHLDYLHVLHELHDLLYGLTIHDLHDM